MFIGGICHLTRHAAQFKATAPVGRLGERDKLLIINKAGIIFDGPNAVLERKEDLWALF
jgi:hypothetical protein